MLRSFVLNQQGCQAGWAACLWQATSNTTPYKLRMAINQSCDGYSTPGTQIGYGVPDFGRAFELMGIKDTPTQLNADNWLNVYPNPFDKKITLEFYNAVSTNDINVGIYDLNGKLVHLTKAGKLPAGNTTINLNTSKLQVGNGIYLVRLQVNGTTGKTYKLVRFKK